MTYQLASDEYAQALRQGQRDFPAGMGRDVQQFRRYVGGVHILTVLADGVDHADGILQILQAIHGPLLGLLKRFHIFAFQLYLCLFIHSDCLLHQHLQKRHFQFQGRLGYEPRRWPGA